MEPNSHDDYDRRWFGHRPNEYFTKLILSIINHNAALEFDSKDYKDVYDVSTLSKIIQVLANVLQIIKEGQTFFHEYFDMGRKLPDLHFVNGILVGVRGPGDPRPPVESHRHPANVFVRWVHDLRYQDVRGNLESFGLDNVALEEARHILRTLTKLGWFDPLDETHELPYLISKGAIEAGNKGVIRRYKGLRADGTKLENSFFYTASMANPKRSHAYLLRVLDPKVKTPSAPPRTKRPVKQLVESPVNRTDRPTKSRPTALKMASSRNPSAKPPTGGKANQSTTQPSTKAASIAPPLRVSSTVQSVRLAPTALTGTSATTLVQSSKAASSATTRVPKRSRVSDTFEPPLTKKGKVAADSPCSSSGPPVVDSVPQLSSSDPFVDRPPESLQKPESASLMPSPPISSPKSSPATATRPKTVSKIPTPSTTGASPPHGQNQERPIKPKPDASFKSKLKPPLPSLSGRSEGPGMAVGSTSTFTFRPSKPA